MTDDSTQKQVLASMAGKQMTQAEVTKLMGTIQVLSSAMSNMVGTYMTPGDHWRANVETGEIEYDLGLAAALDRRAQIGISGHEIAHLRFSDAVKFRRSWSPGDARWVFHVVNILEDRRVEDLMVADFPGLADAIDRLRVAFDKPLVERAVAMAEPHVQFLGALYAIAFGREFVVTHPEAQAAIAEFRDEIVELTRARSSKQIAREVEREGGIADRMFGLRNMTTQEALVRDPDAVAQLPEPTPQQRAEQATGDGSEPPPDDQALAEAIAAMGSGTAAPPEGQPDGPVDGDGGGEPGEGEDGGDSGGGTGAGSSTKPDGVGEGSWAPSPDDLAAMPDGMDDVLRAVADSAATMAELSDGEGGRDGQTIEAVRSDAEQLVKSLTGMREMVGAVRRSVKEAQGLADGGVDDERCRLECDDDAYDRIESQVRAEASVLSRRLNQVLAENRADRLASVTYRTGQRLSIPGLMRAVAEPNHDLVYRRKGRSRNRRYAFSIVGDVSGSMRGEQLSQMAYTAILSAEAIERTEGCELAVYAFGTGCAVLKPFDLSLEVRGGYLGAFGKQRGVGAGGTSMGAALERVGGDMLARYDDSWRRVIMVITDGQPTDGPVCERNIRSLVRHDDFDLFGIGIQTQGRLAKMFPHWIMIQDAWELSPALMRMMRKAVVRG